jgi:uncharacterized protein with HEPN domain
MRSDSERAALEDILHHIILIDQFTRCLEIISEVSRRLTDQLKARHPAIARREMAGAGNIYRHDYEDVAARRVWDTVQIAIPPLQKVVEAEIARRA